MTIFNAGHPVIVDMQRKFWIYQILRTWEQKGSVEVGQFDSFLTIPELKNAEYQV